MTPIDISQSQEIYSVSRLNREVRFMLESNFQFVWIEGEISNFAAPSSGHWYFSLKDASTQVRCAMFKPNNRQLGFIPKDGMHVLIKARVSLYEGRGEFQLLADYLEEIGEGKLRQAFEALKKRLLEAGLFNPAHKKTLPTLPKKIGVVTSPTGAAIRDILSVLKRRFPAIPVIIYPTLVQGELAANHIVQAIELANSRNECDVLLIARGGGSLEDLWPFNEEKVAYAIYNSRIPTISGVGHEIDFTISDFVADVRAPTPSAAAELITPDKNDMLDSLTQTQKQLARQIKQHLAQLQQSLVFSQKHLHQQHPKHRLQERAQQLDLLEQTIIRLHNKKIHDTEAKLHTLSAKLQGLTPAHAIRSYQQLLTQQQQHLYHQIKILLQKSQERFSSLAATLDALSPLSTLKRGFAIATTAKTQHILRHAQDVKLGEMVHVLLMDGSLDCRVEKIK